MLRLRARRATRTSANVNASDPRTAWVKKKTPPRRKAVCVDELRGE